MKDSEIIEQWLRRAKSNLSRAKAGKISNDILYEDLCFDCQQAVEKSIKALLIHLGKEFKKIHSISKLLKEIEIAGEEVPESIKESAVLSIYAVDTRYPGDYEPVNESEFKQTLEIAEKVVKWVEWIIKCRNQL